MKLTCPSSTFELFSFLNHRSLKVGLVFKAPYVCNNSRRTGISIRGSQVEELNGMNGYQLL
jgi:hypothetical protein